MKILAFDLASKTGVAFGAVGGKPFVGSVSLGQSEDHRYAGSIGLCARLIKKYQPDLIAIEAPVGGSNASAFLIGLIACVRGEATRQGVRVVSYYPATIRKHFLGKAMTGRDFPSKNAAAAKKAIKGVVMARCHLLGWDVKDGDAADAAALWDYASARENMDHQMKTVGGLFRAVK